MAYRFSPDLGSTSLGWCLLGLENGAPDRLMDMGGEFFPMAVTINRKSRWRLPQRSSQPGWSSSGDLSWLYDGVSRRD